MKLNKQKVVVAMSGGVDSSVAAVLLKEQGYEVIGITLKLWDPPKNETYKHTSCCSVDDITDARRVADQVGIPFYVINSKENFRENVVEKFVSEYLKGRTPNPCAMCNDKVKFNFLLKKAFELGAYYVATGHFVRKAWDKNKQEWQLFKGSDTHKDQSYFLFSLDQKQLAHTLFPVGELNKVQVRKIAEEHGLRTRAKPESQEICFVPGHHGDFIEKYAPDRLTPKGKILSESGETLGEHEGIYRYTLGQRRGTQVSQNKRVYVKAIDAKNNTVIMSEENSLYKNSLLATGVRWVRAVEDGMEVIARLRYRHEGSLAKLSYQKNADTFRLDFKEAQRAITPGQAVVLYQGDQVLGGGWIQA